MCKYHFSEDVCKLGAISMISIFKYQQEPGRKIAVEMTGDFTFDLSPSAGYMPWGLQICKYRTLQIKHIRLRGNIQGFYQKSDLAAVVCWMKSQSPLFRRLGAVVTNDWWR